MNWEKRMYKVIFVGSSKTKPREIEEIQSMSIIEIKREWKFNMFTLFICNCANYTKNKQHTTFRDQIIKY